MRLNDKIEKKKKGITHKLFELSSFWFHNLSSFTFYPGEHQFGTSYNSTYQQIDGDHRAKQHVQKDTTPLSVRRGTFKGVTQTMSDFPGYHGNQPRPPKAVAPPEPKIDLRFNNK